MKKIYIVLLIVLPLIQGFSQKLSTKPDEFVVQLDKFLRDANQVAFAEQFRGTWGQGTFSAEQQTKIINISQKIIDKRGRIGIEVKNFLEALSNGLDTKNINNAQLDNILSVADKVISNNPQSVISLFAERLNSLLTYKMLYKSKFYTLYVDGNFEIAYSDSTTRSQNTWFQAWQEGDSQPDSLGLIKPYLHPLVVGGVVLFPKTNLYFVTPHDSVSITDTKLAFILEKDMIVGDKGRFSWESLYNKGDVDSVALGSIKRREIYADFDRYSQRVSDQYFKAANATLIYPEKAKSTIKGSFEFLSEKRSSIKNTKFPFFKSYQENILLQNIGTHISVVGGVKLQGFNLYAYSPSGKPSTRLVVTKEGKAKFHANSKEFYLGEEQITSKNTSFSYYVSGSDSLTHSDVVLSYNRVKIPGDSTPSNAFKLYKDKKNDDIPFINEYHKMYITADMALYNVDKNTIDFFILGANDKISAIFESFSYYDRDRYDELHGSFNFHPLKTLMYYADKYGVINTQGVKEFNIAAIFEDLAQQKKKSKIEASSIKLAMKKLAREGYIDYNEYTGEIMVLNRASHSVNSLQYTRAMDLLEENPKKKLPPVYAAYADKDFDDMLIESVSPRDARRDSIKVDSIKFSFSQGRILYPRLEGKNLYITKRVFVPRQDSIATDSLLRDTTIVLTDTFKIDKFTESKKVIFTEDLEVRRMNPNAYILTELEGYFFQRGRTKGPQMPNATIDANGGGMVIRGIERFAISKKLNVYFIPKNKEIRIFGDRVLMMEEGEVTVGNFRFIGKNFTLPYDEFKLTMETIDTVLFAVQDPKNPQLKYELGGEIKLNAGDILLNHPNNKSGLKKGQIPGGRKGETYESFPKLKVETGGRIYFDAFYRERFAYHKSQVYFEIPNVELDSLSSKLPQFNGTFHSNIFPPIKERLVPIYDSKYNGVESKYALGFVHRPKKPLKLYGKNGELKADSIVMYKTGLVASGKNLEINNHTYTVKAQSVVLTPDSVHSQKVSLTVRKALEGKVSYPKASGENLKMSWFTSKDSVRIDSITFKNRETPFKILEDKNPASVKGIVAITPKNFWVIGELARKDFFAWIPKGAIVSPERIYTPAIADNIVEFKVHSADINPFEKQEGEIVKPLIDATAVLLDYDLKKSICKITYNKAIADVNPNFDFIRFPYAQFKTSIKEAIWDVGKKNVLMRADVPSAFTSTKFEEEEGSSRKDITFKAKGGKYDMKDINNPVLELEGVQYIASADARIIPDKGKILILKGADVQELKNATVVVDTINFYHTLINGNIKINHREDFEGDATYRYVNVAKDTARIKFDRFELIGDPISEATGTTKNKKSKKIRKQEIANDTTGLKPMETKKSKRNKKQIKSASDSLDTSTPVVAKKTKKTRKRKEKVVYSDSLDINPETDSLPLKSKKKKKGQMEDEPIIPARYTQSRGEVQESDKFFITSGIQFKGTAEMLAYKKDLILDGFIHLVLKNHQGSEAWIPYQRDAGDVYIELAEKTDAEDQILTSGLHYSLETGKIYTTFLSGKKEEADTDIFLGKGILSYVPERKEFKIIDKNKLEQDTYAGNVFVFDDEKALNEMSGRFNLFDETTAKQIKSAGTIKVNLKKRKYDLNQFFVMDFSKFKAPIAVMGQDLMLNKIEGGEQAYNTEDASMMSKLAEVIGEAKTKKYEASSRGKYVSLLSADKKMLGKSIVLSHVDMHWLDTTHSFYSVGKIGVANILDKDINSSFEGYLEIQKNNDGDVTTLYLQGASDTWYYLSFAQGVLYGESSVERFNNLFSKGKKAKKAGDLSMEAAEEGAGETFKRKFKHYYIDKKLGEVPQGPAKVKEEPTTQEDDEEKPQKEKKSRKKKKKANDDEEEDMPSEEETPKKEEPKKEVKEEVEKPKKEKKSKKKKKKEEDEEEEDMPLEEETPKKEEPKKEVKEEKIKTEPKKEVKDDKKKEEPKKEEKTDKPKKEEKVKEVNKKEEKPTKEKKSKKKKKEEEDEDTPLDEETPKEKKTKKDEKDGF